MARPRCLGHLPIVPRCATIAMIGFGLVGAVVGLIVGLFTYPPTAAFAMVEVGFPAALLGGIVGVLVGLVIAAASARGHRALRNAGEPAPRREAD